MLDDRCPTCKQPQVDATILPRLLAGDMPDRRPTVRGHDSHALAYVCVPESCEAHRKEVERRAQARKELHMLYAQDPVKAREELRRRMRLDS